MYMYKHTHVCIYLYVATSKGMVGQKSIEHALLTSGNNRKIRRALPEEFHSSIRMQNIPLETSRRTFSVAKLKEMGIQVSDAPLETMVAKFSHTS